MELTKDEARDKVFEWARMVESLQDACNLTGVAHAFCRLCAEIRPMLKALGHSTDTDAVNRHPLIVAFVDKLSSLSRSELGAFRAHNWCLDIMSGEANPETPPVIA